MKKLLGALFVIVVGFSMSCWFLYNGGKASIFSVILGYWSGFLTYAVLYGGDE